MMQLVESGSAWPLSEKDRQAIWSAIEDGADSNDEPPECVIREKFGGDTNWYLTVMAW